MPRSENGASLDGPGGPRVIGPTSSETAMSGSAVIGKWRRVSGLGGLLLASSFFFPAVRACSSDYVPVEMVLDAASDPSVEDVLLDIPVLIAPYLFGLLTFAGMLFAAGGRRVAERTADRLIAVLMGVVTALLLAMIVLNLPAPGDWDVGEVVIVAMVLLTFVYLVGAARMGSSAAINIRWHGSVCCLAWFGFWFFSDVEAGRYGLWISLAGTLLIALGTITEASIRSGLRAPTTLARLLTCRLRRFDIDGPRCVSCGYLLIGLTSNRCPECGRVFGR